MDFSIRKIKSSDTSVLKEMLYHAIFVPEGAPKPAPDIVEQPELKRYIVGWRYPEDMGFVAVADQRVIGAAWTRRWSSDNPGYGFVDEHTPELSIAVLPGYRGQGIGTKLLARLFQELQDLGVKSVSLSVDLRNPAVRLYERFGFTIAEVKGTSCVMQCRLS
jgi:ribosomal protein S18 acetylase RimI-like enzyme